MRASHLLFSPTAWAAWPSSGESFRDQAGGDGSPDPITAEDVEAFVVCVSVRVLIVGDRQSAGPENDRVMTAIDLSYRPESYWPDHDPPEEGVVLASISVESVLGDTTWVTALAHESGIRLRVHDDNDSDHPAQPETAPSPLSLGELIELMDNVSLGDEIAPGLVYGLLDYNSLVGTGNRGDTDFIAVTSEVYPGLSEHYDQRIEAWVMGDHGAGADRRTEGSR